MSSDSEDENVIRYGTPLEPYEEDEVPSKRKCQPPDQYAVDSHGRRRFHGAFTGGFSAGFGNTVGTPEGWTPANFKSSRSEKAQVSSRRPEDFMDEEDRSEFGIAPRTVVTHSEFSGQKRPRQKQYFDGTIPGEPVLNQLIRAVHETAAVRILRGMGWRDGRGAGERVTKDERRAARERHKVYGCYIPPELRQTTDQQSEEDSSGSEFEFETLFAPDDYEPYVLNRKSDRFGLGYSGLSRRSVLGSMTGEYGSEDSRTSHLVMRDKGKKVSIRGQAFGVGAFEADDDDIYATEDMSHYDRVLGGPSKEDTQQKKSKKTAHILEGFVPSSRPLPPVAVYPPPALPRGYTPAVAGQRRSRFEPTDAPQRNQGLGRHELTAEARGNLLGEMPLQKQLETSIQSPSIQFDSIQPESIQTSIQDKEDPIAKLLGRNVSFVSTNVVDETKKKDGPEDFISIKDSGQELTNSFKPFAGNPAKQKRYEKYLKDKEGYIPEQEGTMDKLSEWEREREMIEFEQAAKLYKPLTGIMGDRFTHASEPDEALNPLCAVAKSSVNYGLATPEQIEAAKKGVYGVMTRRETPWRPESLVCKRFNVPEPGVTRDLPKKDEKSKISYSVFSYLESSVHDKDSFTKEQSKFSGSKSLASDVVPKNKSNKADNDRNKTSEVNTSSVGGTGDANSKNTNEGSSSTSTEVNTGFTKRLTVAELFLKESEKNKKEGKDLSETINNFDKMDLYKSIFLSDSEEEDPKPTEKTEISFEDFLDGPKNVERNTSPPKGIFANVNFDELNSWRRNADDKKLNDKTRNDKEPNLEEKISANDIPTTSGADKKSSNYNINVKDVIIQKSNQEVTDTDIYGPKIPESLKKRLEETTEADKLENFRPIFRKDRNNFSSKKEQDNVIHEVDSSSSDSWVDVREVKSKKDKKKKSKKHKSKHKKSKYKKKDR